MNSTIHRRIPLFEAIDLLAACTAVQVDEDSLVYPLLYQEGDDEHDKEGLFLLLTTAYADEQFATKSNETVTIDGYGRMILVNTRGEMTTILLLNATPVPVSP